MNVFFEESGSFKAGAVLSRQGEALQVELPGGRRAKVRARDVLIEFEKPDAAALMAAAQAQAESIDIDFLWQCANDEEFNHAALAAEYFGADAEVAERVSLLLRLHGSPIYFRRKGRGNYQRAAEEQLQAALAALERRRQQAEVQRGYEEELQAGRLPLAFEGKVLGLLVKPDKNSIEFKALEAAAGARGITPVRLMIECGGIESPRAWHEARFLAEHFPRGVGFGDFVFTPPVLELPEATVRAFSIDDVTTTEIDDAISVQRLDNGNLRVGIHIAAPALGLTPGDAVDSIARERLSTVYTPGEKITMLPESVVDAYSLKEGGLRPALSLYLVVNPSNYEILNSETRAERVFIAHNLRHNELESIVTEESLETGEGDYPHREDLVALWPLAQALHEKRQQTRLATGLRREVARLSDFNFYIEGDHVTIAARRRGSPLDLIVAELAIFANSSWGAYLAEYGVPAIYRAQRAFGPNRTRMQTAPAPHEGLGVAQYAWSTSPLRRYVDLVNQWQLLAVAEHGVAAKLAAPFKPRDATLFAIVQGFDETYAAYADHQSRMERFWCLRWLRQEGRSQIVAQVIKADLLRLEEIPLTLVLPGVGTHARGTRLLLEVLETDELNLDIKCRLVEVLDGAPALEETATEEESEAGLEDAPIAALTEVPSEGQAALAGGDDTIAGASGDADGSTEGEQLEAGTRPGPGSPLLDDDPDAILAHGVPRGDAP